MIGCISPLSVEIIVHMVLTLHTCALPLAPPGLGCPAECGQTWPEAPGSPSRGHPAAPSSVLAEQRGGASLQRVCHRLFPPERPQLRGLPEVLLHGRQPPVHQLLLDPRPGICSRRMAGHTGGTAKPRAGWTRPQSQAAAPPWPLLLSQVHGSSEAPSQFSLTNAAGTHTTSMGISSPSPGELVFSSFHSLLSGPHFWNLPSCFRGDKVGRGREQKRKSRQQEEHRQRLRSRVLQCLERSGGKGGGGSGRLEQRPVRLWGPPLSACSPRAPGDFLWRRATLHGDPAAPAWLAAPAPAAVGGTARQWHRLGASLLPGA